MIWDMIHPVEDGEAPEETIAFLSKQCAHVHVKDGRPFDDAVMHDWKYTRLGEGILPIRHIIELLLQDGYEGFFSLEWEAKWREEIQFPDYAPEKVLEDYIKYMKG